MEALKSRMSSCLLYLDLPGVLHSALEHQQKDMEMLEQAQRRPRGCSEDCSTLAMEMMRARVSQYGEGGSQGRPLVFKEACVERWRRALLESVVIGQGVRASN